MGFKYPLPMQVDMFAFRNRNLTQKRMKTVHTDSTLLTHQLRSAHSKAVLVNRPGGSIEYDHLALVQRAP